MSKKTIGFLFLLISLTLVVPLNAKGPGTTGNRQSTNDLTDVEIEYITYMREEEKLARDVYLTLYDLYSARIFGNISESEQRHMDAFKRLIDKHGLTDPVENDDIGEFTNPDFAKLYGELVEMGKQSYCGALQVGISIEELDINDLELALNDVTAQDITRVFNNLLAGSYNHLNAFNSQYGANSCE